MMVDYKRVTIFESVLQNGSYKFEVNGQNSGCYAFKEDIYFIPKEGQGSISREIGSRFMRMFTKIIVESGCRITMFSSNGGKEFCDPYYKISPKSNPQHRFLLNSSRFDEHGVLEPNVQAYGVKLLHDLEPLLIRKVLFFFSTNFTNGFAYWKSVHNIDDSIVQMDVELRLYDLRTIQTLKQNCRRAWATERTMTRRMTQEFERLVNGPKKHFKGVRWRPERKHPWVAELKLSTNKKAWIGDFDTAEDAAQVYETVARQFKVAKERTTQQLGFFEDSMLRRIARIAKTRKQSTTYSGKQQQQQTWSEVALHDVLAAEELKKRRGDSDVDIIGVNYGVASSSSWSNSICNTETGITKLHDDDIGKRFEEFEAPTGAGVATLVHHDSTTSQESSTIITDTQDFVDFSFHFAHITSFHDDRLGLDMCANDFMPAIMADETFDVQGLSPSLNNLVITSDFHDIAPSTFRKYIDNERIRSAVEGQPFVSLVEENVSGGNSTNEVLECIEEIKSAITRGSEELDPFCEWAKWIEPNDSTDFDFETRKEPCK